MHIGHGPRSPQIPLYFLDLSSFRGSLSENRVRISPIPTSAGFRSKLSVAVHLAAYAKFQPDAVAAAYEQANRPPVVTP